MIKNNILGITAILLSLVSCTNLEEKVYSEVTTNNFYTTEGEVISALMRPYGHLRQTYLNFSTNGCGVFLLQELTTDEACWPTKGRDGFDNGNWIRLHKHTWTVEDGAFEMAWNDMYKGIALTNIILSDIEKVNVISADKKQQYTSELRAIRALYYYYLLDLFGNVPIVTSISDFSPSNSSKEEVYNFIEKELITVQGNLLNKNDKGWYGRFTQQAVDALLSRLYLNAQVYTGVPQWEKCIERSEKVLASNFQLDSDWQTPFLPDNFNSQENVFVIPNDGVYANDQQVMFQFTTHWQQRVPQFGYNGKGGYNGMVSVREFIQRYDIANDKRCYFDSRALNPDNKNDSSISRGQFMWGLQYGRDGKPVLGTNEYNGKQLDFQLDVLTMENGTEQSGARNIKYQVEYGATGFSNDFVLFRLAEVYFNLAEASIRKNGTVSNLALEGLNTVRARAGVSVYGMHLTLNELYNEKGREMAYEGIRRTDMIRFGTYTGARWDKEVSQNYRNLFPIPQKSRNSNLNLMQNNGYPQ